VDGIELVKGDLTVQRYIDLGGSSQQYGTHTDNDVVVRLDLASYPELLGEWVTRELINRIQKLRKKAGLQATDNVDIYISVEDQEGDNVVREAMNDHSDSIRKSVGSMPVDVKEKPEDATVIIMEEQEVAGRKILLWLAHPGS